LTIIIFLLIFTPFDREKKIILIVLILSECHMSSICKNMGFINAKNTFNFKIKFINYTYILNDLEIPYNPNYRYTVNVANFCRSETKLNRNYTET
jgi:hypothetical protein